MNDENCALLGYYVASSGNFLQKLRATYQSYLQELKIQKQNAKIGTTYYPETLVRNLTFLGPCIVSIYQYISSKMQRYTVYLYLEIALRVSGGTSTHQQERKQLYLQHLVFVTPLLLSTAIVEELELVFSVLWVAYATHSTLKPVPTLPR